MNHDWLCRWIVERCFAFDPARRVQAFHDALNTLFLHDSDAATQWLDKWFGTPPEMIVLLGGESETWVKSTVASAAGVLAMLVRDRGCIPQEASRKEVAI